MFVIILEGNARSWYEGFLARGLYSLRYFHTVFQEHLKYRYPSLLLVQYCCTYDQGFLENLKDIYGEEEMLDEQILEILHEYSFKNK